jgi:hypothetical protein
LLTLFPCYKTIIVSCRFKGKVFVAKEIGKKPKADSAQVAKQKAVDKGKRK